MILKASNCCFLTESQISSLNKLNIHTVEQFVAYSDFESLSRFTKIPLDKLKFTFKYLVGQYASLPQNGSDLFSKYVKSLRIIPTGFKELDKMLQGGIYSHEITEIIGHSSTARSSLVYNILANILVQISSELKEQLERSQCKSQTNPKESSQTRIEPIKVLYIDTSANFSIHYLQKVLKKYLPDESQDEEHIKELLMHISITYCDNFYALLDILFKLERLDKLQANNNDVIKFNVSHLIVIDTYNNLFTSVKGSFNEFQSFVNYSSRCLKFIVNSLSVPLLVINNQYTNEGTQKFFTLGPQWDNVANVKLSLSESTDGCDTKPIINLLKHPRAVSDVSCCLN